MAARPKRWCLVLALLGAGACASMPSPDAPVDASTPDLLAPPGTCGVDDDPALAAAAQLEAVRCLVNEARRRAGREPLAASSVLDGSAANKAEDVVRCGELLHEACGRETSHWFDASGYTGGQAFAIAENLALGTGRLGAPRSIVRGWLDSPGHRTNMLRADFAEVGVGRRTGGTFDRGDGTEVTDAIVWVLHLGWRE